MTTTSNPAPLKSRRRSGLVRLLGTVAIGIVAVIGTAGPAAAHTNVTGTSPTDNQSLNNAPKTISVSFNEPVTEGRSPMRIVGSNGTDIATVVSIIPEGAGARVEARPTTTLINGWYAVAWEVVAVDGHTKTGTFTFLVGQDASGQAAKISDPTAPFRKATDPLRFFGYITTLLAVGLLIASWPMTGLSAHKTTLAAAGWAAGAGLVTAPLTLLNYAMLLNGGTKSGLNSVFVIALQSSAGTALLVRTSALFALCTAVLLASERSLRWFAAAAGLAGAIGLAVSYSFSGHTTVVPLSKFAGPLLVLHLLAAAAWLGGLPALAWVFRKRSTLDDAQLIETTRRFSLVATVSIIVVGVAGTALAVMMFTKPSDLFSDYGKYLLLKVAAVAVFAGMGAYNHFIAVPSLKKQAVATATPTDEVAGVETDTETDTPVVVTESPARARLRKILRIEAVGIVVVTLLTALVTTTGAPASGGNHGLDSHGHDGGVSLNDTQNAKITSQGKLGDGGVEVSLAPGRAGVLGTLTVRITDALGATVEATAVRVELTNASIGLGPIERTLTRSEKGIYSIETRDFGIAGAWSVKVIAQTGALDTNEASLEIVIPSTGPSTPRPPLERAPEPAPTTTPGTEG